MQCSSTSSTLSHNSTVKEDCRLHSIMNLQMQVGYEAMQQDCTIPVPYLSPTHNLPTISDIRAVNQTHNAES